MSLDREKRPGPTNEIGYGDADNGGLAAPDADLSVRYSSGDHAHGFPTTPEALTAGPGVLDLIRALRRRWFLALMAGLLAAAAATISLWYFLPLRYVARAQIYVAAERPWFVNPPLGNGGFDNFQKTQMAQVKGRLVLIAALRDPAVAETSLLKQQPDPILWLEKNLQVDFNLAPEILRVSLAGEKPGDLVTVLNAITRAYLDEVANKEERERRTELHALGQLKQTLDTERQEKVRLQKRVPEAAPPADPNTARKVESLNWQLDEVQGKILALGADLKGLQDIAKNKAGAAIPDSAIERKLDEEPAIQKIRSQIVQVEAVANSLIPGTPLFKQAQEKLDGLKRQEAEKRLELRPKVEDEMRQHGLGTHEKDLLAKTETLAIQKNLEATLRDELKRLGGGHSEPKRDGGLTPLQAEIEGIDAKRKKVEDRLQVLELEQNAPPRVRPMDEDGALVAPQYEASRRATMAASGGAGLFFLALVGVAWWEFQRRRVGRAEDIAQVIGLRILGSLPDVSRRMRPWLPWSRRDPYAQGMLTESVANARAVVLRAARTESVQVLMVTSALSGEGKTSLASHLSASLARAGHRTLLIDGDLRKPTLHRLFDLPAEPGLTNLLTGSAEAAQAIQATRVAGLWLLPAGMRTPAAAQSLASKDGIRALLARLREEFDFIIVDTSPVLLVADPLLVGEHSDGVLISLLQDVSRLPTVHLACQRLTDLGIRVLGGVMNGASAQHYGSSYGYANESVNGLQTGG